MRYRRRCAAWDDQYALYFQLLNELSYIAIYALPGNIRVLGTEGIANLVQGLLFLQALPDLQSGRTHTEADPLADVQ